MRGWLPLTLGLLAVVVGAVWTLQGLGHLDGSVMTGQRIWAVLGPLLALAGLVLVGLGLRARRRATTPTQAQPAQADPAQADPAQADPAQADPAQPGRERPGTEQGDPEQRRAPQ